jgi:hypothetical protein
MITLSWHIKSTRRKKDREIIGGMEWNGNET